MSLYPLKFNPILKKVIWGGSDIASFKNLPPQDGIGESWEISAVENNVSIVSEGILKGQALDALIRKFKWELVGKKVYDKFGNTFPLLIKFIDAKEDLSIQVHPNDELAKKRHNSFGKTEMWYLVKAAPGAYLYSGFEKQIDAQEYPERIKNNTIIETLKKYEVKDGDVFFLPAGRVHAIGTGCFVAEIQQTSNITYRIYDYDRRDVQGNARELHTELAKEAIDYQVQAEYKTKYIPQTNVAVKLVECPYFSTSLMEIDKEFFRDYQNIDSFIILICMQGKCSVEDSRRYKIELNKGQSILIPANTDSIKIIPVSDESSKILETYVP